MIELAAAAVVVDVVVAVVGVVVSSPCDVLGSMMRYGNSRLGFGKDLYRVEQIQVKEDWICYSQMLIKPPR